MSLGSKLVVKVAEGKGEGNQKGIKTFPIRFHCKGGFFNIPVSKYLVVI